jgi:hypothetical protein
MRLGETPRSLGGYLAGLEAAQASAQPGQRGLVCRDPLSFSDETGVPTRDRPVEPRRISLSEQRQNASPPDSDSPPISRAAVSAF